MFSLLNFIFVIFLGLVLSGCSALGVATGVGATAGLSAAQEGGLSRAIGDAKIQAYINEAWFNYDVNVFTKLDITVNQGRVLVTGVVQDPQHRVEAVRLIWQVDGVEQVINEVQVARSPGIGGYLQDSWILTRLRTDITLDKQVQSLNYNIDAVNGTVYLLGVAQDQTELNKVIEAARGVSGVRQVVSYVKIAGPDRDTYYDSNIPVEQRNFDNVPVQVQQAPPTYQEEQIIWNEGRPEATGQPQNINTIETEYLE